MSFLKSNKILYHLDRLKQWDDTGDTSAPINVKIDLTNVCQHNCPGCTGFGMIPISEVYGDRLKFDAIYKTLGELKEAGVKGVNFTGGGEPTLYKKFEQVIRRCDELELEVGLITNGGAFQILPMEDLLSMFLWVRISLDGFDTSSHKKTHGSKAKFDLTVKNMKDLSRIKREQNLDVTLGAAYLTNQFESLDRNCHKFVEIVKDCGFDYAQIRPSFGHFFDYESIKIEEWREIFKKLKGYREENFKVFFNELKYEKIFSGDTGRKYKSCHAQSFKSTAITATGDVYVCCSLSGVKDGYIGNIYKQTFSEIWNGEERKNMLKNLDVQKCPKLCIGDELNEYLEDYKKNQPLHKNFL